MIHRTLILILFVFNTLLGFSTDKPIKSKLNEVTVFLQGAELVHSAVTPLSTGENEVSIEGLSPNIDHNSLKIKAGNGVIISAFEFSVDYLSAAKAANPVTKILQDSISKYHEELVKINTNTGINKQLIGLLQKGVDKNVAGSEKGLDVNDLIKMMDYYHMRLMQAKTAINTDSSRRVFIANDIARIQKGIQTESLKKSKTSGVLKLKLSSPVTASCTLTISYFTDAASWVPYYDINVASTELPIKIVGKSKVRQTTGLDWEKVKLTLSTATPSTSRVAPLFSAWFMADRYVPAASGNVATYTQNAYSYSPRASLKLARKKSASTDASEEKPSDSEPTYIVDGTTVDEVYALSIDPESIKSQTIEDGAVIIRLKNSMDDYVTQTDNQLNMVYNIAMPYTIPGNGKEQSIELQTKETTAEYKYYCAPKLDPGVFLLAEISNWEELNLLSGQANVTYDGTYVGESYINAASTHEVLSLTLGTDKRVVVKREKMQDFSSIKFLGSDIKQVFTYKLTVKNNQTKPISMILKDQYPISGWKNINVELLPETSAFTVNKEDVGVITWEGELKPGESQSHRISYSVKYPKGRDLNLE